MDLTTEDRRRSQDTARLTPLLGAQPAPAQHSCQILTISDSIELDNLRFVSLRWLRKLKQAAGRHKDLAGIIHA
jgi:hypothetical protein